MGNLEPFFTRLVARNLDGRVNCIDRLAWHEGNYKITCLHRVAEDADGVLALSKQVTITWWHD